VACYAVVKGMPPVSTKEPSAALEGSVPTIRNKSAAQRRKSHVAAKEAQKKTHDIRHMGNSYVSIL
jgi:hypothetical protein